MKNILFLIIFSFYIGCGTGGEKSLNDGLTLYINNSKLEDDNSNVDPKISKAIKSIKDDLKDEYRDAYISKDSQNIFVVTQNYYIYTLYNYDISTDPPKVKNIINNDSKQIVDIYPINDKKMIYLVSPFPYEIDIMVYDYDKQTMIKELKLDKITKLKFHIDEKKKELYIDTYTLHYSNISNIYLSNN